MLGNEGMIRRYQPLMLSGATTITQKKSGDLLKLLGANADILSLGDATHEGGDIKIYRDMSGNLQLSLDADAASNTKALDVYGGVVFQNYLTVGDTSLHTAYPLFVNNGGIYAPSSSFVGGYYLDASALRGTTNRTNTGFDVAITDAAHHYIKMQINAKDIIVAGAAGDGAGGITDKSIGFFDVAPQTQSAHIADADGTLADITTKFNTLIADLQGYGLLASA